MRERNHELKINRKRVASTSFLGFGFVGSVGTSGKSVTRIQEDVKRNFLQALVAEGLLWPIVQVANFRFEPAQYQLLIVYSLLAGCSWIEQQEDTTWKIWLKPCLPSKEQKGQEG